MNILSNINHKKMAKVNINSINIYPVSSVCKYKYLSYFDLAKNYSYNLREYLGVHETMSLSEGLNGCIRILSAILIFHSRLFKTLCPVSRLCSWMLLLGGLVKGAPVRGDIP